MSFGEIQRIQKILRLVQQLQQLQRKLKDLSSQDKEKFLSSWVPENGGFLANCSEEELESVREQADYDAEEWTLILQKLKKS